MLYVKKIGVLVRGSNSFSFGSLDAARRKDTQHATAFKMAGDTLPSTKRRWQTRRLKIQETSRDDPTTRQRIIALVCFTKKKARSTSPCGLQEGVGLESLDG